jgi:hypothetical protein
MGKHSGKPANEQSSRLVWPPQRDGDSKAKNFDDYDELNKSKAKDDNPYSKENFNK